jgi:4-hydroxybenzoate polyprenyltransferase
VNLIPYIYLMRLHKPIGILLLLWPTLWALWLAGNGKPNLIIVIVFALGVFLMRTAGCIINDIADRNFDAHVERTRSRPLATKEISVKSALLLFAVLCFIAFLLVLQLNRFTICLAFVGLGLAVLYPFMKRFTHLPQVGLGLAFAWGVPMAFAAEQGALPTQSWIVFLAACLWPIIYDTMYAITDREDDVKIGIKSTAILFAAHEKKILFFLQLVFLFLLIIVGVLFAMQWPYFLSIFFVAILFGYQLKLIHMNQSFKAFLNNNWVGMIVFIGIMTSYLIK